MLLVQPTDPVFSNIRLYIEVGDGISPAVLQRTLGCDTVQALHSQRSVTYAKWVALGNLPEPFICYLCLSHLRCLGALKTVPSWGTVWCWSRLGTAIYKDCVLYINWFLYYLVPRISIILVYLWVLHGVVVISALNLHDVEKSIKKFFSLVFGYCFRHEINISFLSLRKE